MDLQTKLTKAVGKSFWSYFAESFWVSTRGTVDNPFSTWNSTTHSVLNPAKRSIERSVRDSINNKLKEYKLK